MKRSLTKTARATFLTFAVIALLWTSAAQALIPDWPDIFEPNWPKYGGEPNELLTLNIDMDPCDWQAILHNHPDETGCIPVEVEVPAYFWADGEDPNGILVAVRRKKSFAFPDETNPEKVALKIDINQYISEQDWHGLIKLSLESNADSIDLVSEGLACNLHRTGSLTEGYGWPIWHANWVKVYVNGEYKGVYVNNEQYDKRYMQNRGLYIWHQTWLYKYADCVPGFVLKVGDDFNPKSPAVEALCYDPFVHPNDPALQPSGGVCSVPDDANVIADMNEFVNMKRMLSSAAITAFLANSDPLFESSNNTYFLDFNLDDPCETRKRMYMAWDVDASFKSVDKDIYYTGSSSTYEEVILQKPVFRSQYNQIMKDLLDGPFTEANIHAFLDMVEPVITDAIEADPYNQVGSNVAGKIAELKTWISDRISNVRNQVDWDEPQLPPGIVLLNDDFSSSTWDTNWQGGHSLVADAGHYAHGAPSAKAPAQTASDFICNAVDTSDATAIHIEFWFEKDDTDTGEDIILYYYNGTTYDQVCDMDLLGADDEWLRYKDTITDSNYFIPNFSIKFAATPEKNENVWIDEVVITKEAPMLISGTILVGGSPLESVAINANNGGGSDTADVNGFYELEVPFDWSGTVTPTKTGYTFSPTELVYSNVTSDQTTQDYTATLNTYTISGTILVGGSPLADVNMAGLPGAPVTDSNGEYSDTVDYDWSGTVTPDKDGYTFSPTELVYSNVTSDQTAQDYTATLNTYTISGTILVGGLPLADVNMAGLPGAPVTDSNGEYSDTVDYDWSGTVTPNKDGYTFSPTELVYSNVTSDQTAQDYTATLNTYTISGTILVGGLPLAGVSMGGLPGAPVTNGSGFYTDTVDYGWSGTVTPSKAGYTFSPSQRVYGSVSSNYITQDYTATLNTYTISGTILVGGSPLADVNMAGLPGAPVTNGSGFYTDTVDYGWSGTVTPDKDGYTFSPVNKVYGSVTSDQTTQDYTATLNTYTISGTISCGGSMIEGVVMSGLPSDPCTDGSGFYTAAVDYAWSGTVTPLKEDRDFTPTDRTYGSVSSNQTTEDYAGRLIFDLDPDCVIDGLDLEVLCTNWLTTGPTADFDTSGIVDFRDYARLASAWASLP